MERKRYKNPPVVEVVCDFRFTQNSHWDLTIPGLIYEKLSDMFPTRQHGNSVEAEFSPGPGGFQHRVQLTERLQLKKKDDSAMVQISPHHLTINHFTPYTSWEEFLLVVDHTLQIYHTVANPKGFERIGLRYINEIAFSEEHIRLEDYFDLYPFLGNRLPQNFNAFIVGLQIPYDDGKNILKVQMTSKNPNIILDLDYFLGNAVWNTFQMLPGREIKKIGIIGDRLKRKRQKADYENVIRERELFILTKRALDEAKEINELLQKQG
ncbi:hypothetical protein BSNK01_30690 [Bacillaceae bacterium]